MATDLGPVRATCKKKVFLIKRKLRVGEYPAKLTFLWYDNFGKKGLVIGMAWLPFQKFKVYVNC